MNIQHPAGFDLGLAPDTGGSVRYFRLNGIDLLCPAGALVRDLPAPMLMSAFPMFPFSGRIRDGRFGWQGRDVELASNFPPEPHAIHGQSWLAPWQAKRLGPDSVQLTYEHTADSWPWAYRAVQTFRLSADGLHVDLSLTNLSDEIMPAGLGWHPYFPADGAIITANTVRTWTTDDGKLPIHPMPPTPAEQLSSGRYVSDLNLDTPFEIGARQISVEWPDRGLKIRMQTDDTLRFLVVYTPQDEGYFCAEPVSHVPDMVNLDAPADETGLVALRPGGTLTGRIQLNVEMGMVEAGKAGSTRVSAR
jgi:aldose 1-epimerase